MCVWASHCGHNSCRRPPSAALRAVPTSPHAHVLGASVSKLVCDHELSTQRGRAYETRGSEPDVGWCGVSGFCQQLGSGGQGHGEAPGARLMEGQPGRGHRHLCDCCCPRLTGSAFCHGSGPGSDQDGVTKRLEFRKE